MDAGVGAVILANAAVDLGPIANFARKLRRAALTGASIPDAPVIHCDPTVVEDACEYEGTYGNENTSFKLVTKDKRLVIVWKAERLILERRGMDAFLVPHGDFALFLLRFDRQHGHVVAATFGSDHYVKERFGRSVAHGVARRRTGQLLWATTAHSARGCRIFASSCAEGRCSLSFRLVRKCA